MTVTYTLEVSRARLCGFPKLLARWKGSIYRLMYREMIIFLIAYYSTMLTYRTLMNENQRKIFEALAVYCREFTVVVPITFVLGFYVTFVVGRWWQQYLNIPWPDRVAMEVSSYVQGDDERSRLIRRNLVRYLNLMALLTFQSTSTVVKKRFPTTSHMVEAGLITPEEKIELETTETNHGIWWVPAQWFCQLATTARMERRISDDLHLKSIIDDCMNLRSQCGMIWSYDWISVPLVYTQVVTIAVYSFLVASIFGRQYLLEGSVENRGLSVDGYIPLYSIFQFIFYVGWLKVAESMICPFGEDDDDFDMNWIIDRNHQVSLLIADGLHRRYPPLSKDQFWECTMADIPYTQASAKYKVDPFYGSTSAMNLVDDDLEWECDAQMPAIQEEEGKERMIEEDRDSESVASSRMTKKRIRGLSEYLPFSKSSLAKDRSPKSVSSQNINSGLNGNFSPPLHHTKKSSAPMNNDILEQIRESPPFSDRVTRKNEITTDLRRHTADNYEQTTTEENDADETQLTASNKL